MGSAAAFDAAVQLEPRLAAYSWQRGISLYYARRYAEGAAQFRADVAANPNDTEEALWCLLCEAQLSLDRARSRMLVVGQDSRAVLRTAYDVYAGKAPLSDLRAFASGSPRDAFYAALYEGLLADASGDAEASRAAIARDCESEYGLRGGGDYMTAVARTHRRLRE